MSLSTLLTTAETDFQAINPLSVAKAAADLAGLKTLLAELGIGLGELSPLLAAAGITMPASVLAVIAKLTSLATVIPVTPPIPVTPAVK